MYSGSSAAGSTAFFALDVFARRPSAACDIDRLADQLSVTQSGTRALGDRSPGKRKGGDIRWCARAASKVAR